MSSGGGLECSVCFEAFGDADSHVPHVASCGHTFCRGCVQRIAAQSDEREHACPLCRASWARVDEFAVNFGLLAVLDSAHPNAGAAEVSDLQVPCDVCFEGRNESVAECSSCDKRLCSEHARLHPEDHLVGKLDSNLQQRKGSRSRCLVRGHRKKLELFCLTCKLPVCVLCSSTTHRHCQVKELHLVQGDLKMQADKDAVLVRSDLNARISEALSEARAELKLSDQAHRDARALASVTFESLIREVQNRADKVFDELDACAESDHKRLTSQVHELELVHASMDAALVVEQMPAKDAALHAHVLREFAQHASDPSWPSRLIVSPAVFECDSSAFSRATELLGAIQPSEFLWSGPRYGATTSITGKRFVKIDAKSIRLNAVETLTGCYFEDVDFSQAEDMLTQLKSVSNCSFVRCNLTGFPFRTLQQDKLRFTDCSGPGSPAHLGKVDSANHRGSDDYREWSHHDVIAKCCGRKVGSYSYLGWYDSGYKRGIRDYENYRDAERKVDKAFKLGAASTQDGCVWRN